MLAPRDNHLDKAWAVAFQVLHGRLTLDDVAKQIADASLPALQARVDSLLRQLTFRTERDNQERLERLFAGLAHDASGPVQFEVFQRALGTELAGLVLTAHPTFSLSAEANELALELMRGGAASARPSAAGSPSRRVTVRRQAVPTLQEEMDASIAATRQIRKALRRVLSVAVDVAAQHYPQDYRRRGCDF
jgi:phosphoenolpyruvate carboxylase